MGKTAWMGMKDYENCMGPFQPEFRLLHTFHLLFLSTHRAAEREGGGGRDREADSKK